MSVRPKHPPIPNPHGSSQQAADAARRIQAEMVVEPLWTLALKDATAAEPVPVQRLDQADDYYYLADFGKGGVVTARMAIGGSPYTLLRVSGIGREGTHLPSFVTPAGVLDGRTGMPFGVGAARHRIVRPGTVGVHPVLVWKSCAQSRSPLLPFYLLSVGDVVSYLRVDGKLFARLDVGQPGR